MNKTRNIKFNKKKIEFSSTCSPKHAKQKNKYIIQ